MRKKVPLTQQDDLWWFCMVHPSCGGQDHIAKCWILVQDHGFGWQWHSDWVLAVILLLVTKPAPGLYGQYAGLQLLEHCLPNVSIPSNPGLTFYVHKTTSNSLYKTFWPSGNRQVSLSTCSPTWTSWLALSSGMLTNNAPSNSRIPTGLSGIGLLSPSIRGFKVPQRMITMKCLIGRMMIDLETKVYGDNVAWFFILMGGIYLFFCYLLKHRWCSEIKIEK